MIMVINCCLFFFKSISDKRVLKNFDEDTKIMHTEFLKRIYTPSGFIILVIKMFFLLPALQVKEWIKENKKK
jgi:hypothetical protein